MKLNGKDDAVKLAEVHMSAAEMGLAALASPGSKTTACMTIRVDGNPGGPKFAFQKERRSEQPKQGREDL